MAILTSYSELARAKITSHSESIEKSTSIWISLPTEEEKSRHVEGIQIGRYRELEAAISTDVDRVRVHEGQERMRNTALHPHTAEVDHHQSSTRLASGQRLLSHSLRTWAKKLGSRCSGRYRTVPVLAQVLSFD